MAIYSLELTNIDQHDIMLYEKEHNVKVDELVSDFVYKLLKSKKAPQDDLDYSDIEALAGKYTQYAQISKPISIDDMNELLANAMKKEWLFHESS